jgi:cysteinyl-tRNA synthetase, unknown class
MWVKYWTAEWKSIVLHGPNSYIEQIIRAGFDGVYLDNVEAYYSIYFD